MTNFKGTINIVTDLNLAMQYCNTCKVLYVGEFNHSIPSTMIEFSILLPPFEALDAEINGDMPKYVALYNNYLLTNKYVFESVISIIAAAYSGVNIIMYIEAAEDLSHMQVLMDHFYQFYGITLGSPTTVFAVDPSLIPQNLVVLYSLMSNIVPLEVVLMNIPSAEVLVAMDTIHPMVRPLEKIAEENNLAMIDQISLVKWIEQYRNRLMMINTAIVGPVIIWNKEKKE